MEDNKSKDENSFVKPEDVEPRESQQPANTLPTDETQTTAPLTTETIEVPAPKKKKLSKERLFVIASIVIAGLLAGYWFLLRDKDSQSTSSNQQSQTNQVEQTSTFATPDKVIYAFRESETMPFTIYSRPVGGGGRTELTKLEKDEFVNHSDVRNNVIAFATDKAIFVSTDGGSSFNSIFELQSPNGDAFGDQITSLKINTEGSAIVFGLLPGTGGNQVTSMDLSGDKKTTLFESESRGVFIDAWSEKANKIVYSTGCYNCDGNLFSPVVRDLGTGKESKLSQKADPGTITSVEANDDLSQVVIAYGKEDKSPQDGIGIRIVAPYTIAKVDANNGTETTVATIGAAGEKNPNGTIKSRNVLAGLLHQSNDIYYTDDKGMYFVIGAETSPILTAENIITQTPFVSKDIVVYDHSDQTTSSDFALMNYTVANQAIVQILSGDLNTDIFGVTTK